VKHKGLIFAATAAIATVTIMAALAALWLPSGNAGFRYPERVGAIPSLYELRNAVAAFAKAHDGALPKVPNDLAPYVATPADWPYAVRPEQLLPHLVIVPVTGAAPPIQVGPGRYVFMVYLSQSGPMKPDRTIAIGETESGFKEQYLDREIVAAFGDQQLADLRARRSGYRRLRRSEPP
jgi:hypothetical protein